MNLLITYDVSTTSAEGRRRLRRVAQICSDFGRRVQCSVFECSVDDVGFTRLRSELAEEIDLAEDSIRIYRLLGPWKEVVESFGRDDSIDFQDPLIA